MRDEVIFFMDLKESETEKDSLGDPKVEQVLSPMVYAEIKSIGQNEFYQAQTAGQKPQIKFVITDYLDYQGQSYLIHGSMRYSIMRTYRTKGNEMEITCYGGVRNVDAAVGNQDKKGRG